MYHYSQWSTTAASNYSVWIAWDNTMLTVGRGAVAGVDPLVYYNSSWPIRLQYLAVASQYDGIYYAMNWSIPAEFYSEGIT